MATREPERISLAHLPTPLVRLKRLEHELGGAQIWMKRDDLTGLELSGNKIRKLEYILADALNQGCDTIVTEGTCQSNHCRATAAACAQMGLRSFLLLRPQPPAGPPQGNHLLDALFGAQTRSFSRQQLHNERGRIIEQIRDELTAAGHKPRFTPMGASEPLGCWGYIRGSAELAAQLYTAGVEECDVVVALSSGATYAGILLGKLLHRLDHWQVSAVPVSDDAAYHRREVGKLCSRTVEQYELPVEFDERWLRFEDGYVGDGYAIPYPKAIDALRLLARVEGIVLDPVYTAKAFCALLDGVRAGRLGRERPVVFIHTGGIFSNFAWPNVVLGHRGS